VKFMGKLNVGSGGCSKSDISDKANVLSIKVQTFFSKEILIKKN